MITLTRRQFQRGLAASAGVLALGGVRRAQADRNDQLNILCWEGYNTDGVLSPFRERHPGVTIRAESGTSDPDMINKLRAGEVNVWDLINVNQPWARARLLPEKLIKPLNKERFMPYFTRMSPQFAAPYPLAFADDGSLIGMPQRYGPFSFVVNTDKISQEMAEDQGWKLFLDPKMKDRYGVLTYDDWNVMHMCAAADLDPFKPLDAAGITQFETVAKAIFAGAKLKSDDLVAMNTALINGEIDAYFTGGTYTASPARLDGQTNVRGITPKRGPLDGKGGFVWVELTSAVNNPNPTKLAEDFLEYVQIPEICKAVGFAEGTYNPVSQMGDPKVFALWNKEELDAIQWESLPEELDRSADFNAIASYDKLLPVYNAAKRG